MKKIIIFLTIFLLVGCVQENKVIKFATGSTGGIYYPYGSAIAELLSDDNHDYTINAYTGNASVSNSYAIDEKQVDMALIQSNVAYWAQEGIGMFENQKISSLRGITTLYPETIQIIVQEDSDIFAISDIVGKTISIGLEDSGNYFDAINLITYYGISLEDFNVKNYSFSESFEAFKTGAIDGIFMTSGLPTTSVELLNAQKGIRILSLNHDTLEHLIEEQSYYTITTILKDTYQGVDQVETLSTQALWVVHEDLNDDLVYDMTKTFWEERANLTSLDTFSEYLSLERALIGMSIPLHDGAKKYYKEIGFEMD